MRIFGKVFPFNIRRKPKKYGVYWTVDSDNCICLRQWLNSREDKVAFRNNLVFNNEVEAIQERERRAYVA